MAPALKVDDVAFSTLQVPALALREKLLIEFGMLRIANPAVTVKDIRAPREHADRGL